jgi:hypothetical protein
MTVTVQVLPLVAISNCPRKANNGAKASCAVLLASIRCWLKARRKLTSWLTLTFNSATMMTASSWACWATPPGRCFGYSSRLFDGGSGVNTIINPLINILLPGGDNAEGGFNFQP